MEQEPETILIVDDEETVRKQLIQKLHGEGYNCREAADAEEALKSLAEREYGLVILDNKMPGKSGLELLPEIKNAYPDIAIIIATATNDIGVAIECMKRGAYDCITKPIMQEEIVLSVFRAFEKRNLILENNDYRQHLEDKVTEQTTKIKAISLNAIIALVNALEAKDKYTSGHSLRVASIAVAIAREAGLHQDEIDRIQMAALVHDIGKIGVRESILHKPSSLDHEEMIHMQKHSEIGEHILMPIAGDKEMLRLVRNHHEHYNGTGYPDGLVGGEIPLGARILAVSDSFEAMISERPYRAALSEDAAKDELKRCIGTQFDGYFVDIFLHSHWQPRPVQ